MSAADVAATIREERVLGIVRSDSAESALETALLLIDAGLRAVEVSLTTPGGLDAIRQLAAAAPRGVAIGAGTVLSEASAQAAIASGARFVVSPVLTPAVLAVARQAGVATMPGAATPTEMLTALTLGAELVKIFPANLWSPALLSDLLEALPQLPLVPTGGIAVDRADEWISAGAVAVGMGGAIARASVEEIANLRARVANAGQLIR